jgi:hypothetical protein
MTSMFAWSAVDRRFEPLSSQTKDYEIYICVFSAKHAALRRKSKDWFARNQDNVSEGASTIEKNPTKRVGIIQSGPHLIENVLVLVMILLKIVKLALDDNHSLTINYSYYFVVIRRSYITLHRMHSRQRFHTWSVNCRQYRWGN